MFPWYHINSPEEDKTTNGANKFTLFCFFWFANHTRLFIRFIYVTLSGTPPFAGPISPSLAAHTAHLNVRERQRYWMPSNGDAARGPDEVLGRYRRVLSVFKKKKSMTTACDKVGEDRNTIALNVPIAKLAIGAPEIYAEYKEPHTGKLNDSVEDAVQALKRSGKLLRLGKGSF
ncbi:unnamed protein product [Arctogadus glacialis]